MAASAKSSKAKSPRSSKARTPSEASRSKTKGRISPLNAKNLLFVVEYLKDNNATQAYIRAGYKARGNSAEVNAARLLRNAQISAEIAKRQSQLIETIEKNTSITLENTIKEIAKGAFFDPRKFFNADGSPKQITELDDDTASVLAGMEVLEQFDGSGDTRVFVGYVKKYKLAERKGYLDMLMRHLGGYKADNDQLKSENPLAQLLQLIHGAGSTLPLKS